MSERSIDCRRALRLLAAYLDGELERAEEVDVRRHLETCRSCYSRAEFEKRLKQQMAELRRRPVAPAFEDRIRDLIGQFDDPGEAAGSEL